MPEDKRSSPVNARIFASVPAFVQRLAFADLPADVVAQARRCLLDLIGVAAAGTRTRASGIARSYAASQLCGRDETARILFDGRRAGIAGAAFAGATTIDAIDGHDGHTLTKGHAGVAILPALLALCDGADRHHAIGGHEFLNCLTLGYEIATRAGIAQHASVPEYHCSGSWNSIGCAAVAAMYTFVIDRFVPQLREAAARTIDLTAVVRSYEDARRLVNDLMGTVREWHLPSFDPVRFELGLRIELGGAAAGAGRHQAALAQCNDALPLLARLPPGPERELLYNEVRSNRGTVLMRLGRPAEAAAAFGEAEDGFVQLGKPQEALRARVAARWVVR